MSDLVCYLERTDRGAVIERVRLVGGAIDRTFIPAEAGKSRRHNEDSFDEGAMTTIRQTADWIAEQMSRSDRIAMLCVDADGAACRWLSAPSQTTSVVLAALRRSDEMEVFGEPRTVQAIALAPEQKSAPTTNGDAHRFAVVTMPDATVRVLLDELDRRSITINHVVSLWHLMAGAWDPSVSGAPAESTQAEERVVASDAPMTAILLIEPSGRTEWVWSAGGVVLAAGRLRLPRRKVHKSPQTTEGARRIGSSDHSVVACGAPEVGRLGVDWLAWSAQIGRGPSRIACLGPEVVDSNSDDPRALAEHLTRAWPDTTIDVASVDDPLGRTLLQAMGRADTKQMAPVRGELEGLSHRPGRVHRSLFRWVAVAVALLAVAVGIAGVLIGKQAGVARKQADATLSEQRELLSGLRSEIPELKGKNAGTALRLIDARILKIKQEQPKIDPARPVFEETVAALGAMASAEWDDVLLKDLSITNIRARITLDVPDAETGPRILLVVQSMNSRLNWSGVGRPPQRGKDSRDYVLFGEWLSKEGDSGN